MYIQYTDQIDRYVTVLYTQYIHDTVSAAPILYTIVIVERGYTTHTATVICVECRCYIIVLVIVSSSQREHGTANS